MGWRTQANTSSPIVNDVIRSTWQRVAIPRTTGNEERTAGQEERTAAKGWQSWPSTPLARGAVSLQPNAQERMEEGLTRLKLEIATKALGRRLGGMPSGSLREYMDMQTSTTLMPESGRWPAELCGWTREERLPRAQGHGVLPSPYLAGSTRGTDQEGRDEESGEEQQSGGAAQGDEEAADIRAIMRAVLRADPDELLDPLDLAFSPWLSDN